MDENFEKLKKVSPLEQRQKLNLLTGWTIENGRLEREFIFKDFSRAMIFLNKIVNPIEESQNYPRITLTYNRVFISLFNNAVGALTLLDFEMAESFSKLAS